MTNTAGDDAETCTPPGAAGSPEDEPALDFALLRDGLRFSTPSKRLFELRKLLWSDSQSWDRLLATALAESLVCALYMRLDAKGLLPPPRPDRPAEEWGPGEILDSLYRQNLVRRTAQAKGLNAIVACLNRAGIRPLLLKGARTLWLDHRPWRMMRDLDILIPEDAIAKAQNALIADGFATDPEVRDRFHRHHYPPLFREDLPCSVELHRRGGNRYAEQFSATKQLWACGVRSDRDGLEVLLLPDAEDCWHNLVHHFFGHSGFARGLIPLKGLYEFAAAHGELDGSARERLETMAATDTCGLAAYDLFLAAAIDSLGLEVAGSNRPPADASAIWERMRLRQDTDLFRSWRYPGYRETLTLTLAKDRIDRVRRLTGRSSAVARLQGAARLLPKITRSGRF